MAARWYLARVIGTGTADDPYRAKTADVATSHAAVIPSRADGVPRFGWALVQAPDAATLAADVDHVPLPADAAAKWSGIPAAQRQRVLDRVQTAFGLTLQAAPGDTVRDVVRALGRALDGQQFDPANVRGA